MSQFFRGKKVKKLRNRGRDFLFLAGGAVVLVIPMLVIAAKQSSLVSVGYHITELRDENTRLTEEQVRLRAELTTLSRPDQIWQKSLDLGLRPMPRGQHLQVQIIDRVETTSTGDSLVARVREP